MMRSKMINPDDKLVPTTLRLPGRMLSALDQASSLLGTTRADYIRTKLGEVVDHWKTIGRSQVVAALLEQ